jgi:hypothetical protein
MELSSVIITGRSRRNGYCAGNMDPGLNKHRKMDCNSRKFKGLTQKQQHIKDLHQDIDI